MAAAIQARPHDLVEKKRNHFLHFIKLSEITVNFTATTESFVLEPNYFCLH